MCVETGVRKEVCGRRCAESGARNRYEKKMKKKEGKRER